MNVYFACSITGGRQDEAAYQAIVGALVAAGHDVPTAYLAGPGVIELEELVDAADVFTRDVEWISECDAVIAEVSTPSHGVGYEISYALSLSKPVLCVYRAGLKVSKMILGNTHPQLRICGYRSCGEAIACVQQFLASVLV